MKGLKRLEEKMSIVLESLQERDLFIDIALEASQIAIRTSNEERRSALKNAILNSALSNTPEESMQKMFLSFVDVLTVWHIRLLCLFDDPQKFMKRNQAPLENLSVGAMRTLIETAYPELRGRRDIYDLVWKDLYSRALVNTESLHLMMMGSSLVEKRTTTIGRMFLEFIRSPFED